MHTLLCPCPLWLAYLLTTPVERMPNARHELRLEAGATQERTLEAVSSMPLLGVPGTDYRLH